MLPDEASTNRQQSRNLKGEGYIHVEQLVAGFTPEDFGKITEVARSL